MTDVVYKCRECRDDVQGPCDRPGCTGSVREPVPHCGACGQDLEQGACDHPPATVSCQPLPADPAWLRAASGYPPEPWQPR